MKSTYGIFFFFGAALLCGTYTYAQTVDASGKSCLSLSDSTVTKVCTGDLVQSRRSLDEAKPAVAGTVVKIETGIFDDGKPMGILSVQTSAGISRITSRGFVFMNPGTCVQDSQSRDRVCMGETFKNHEDGQTYQVMGFTAGEGHSYSGYGSDGVVVRDVTVVNDRERVYPASVVYESHKVAATGKFTRHGSCDSEMPFLDSFGYGSLGSCATKSAALQLNSSCNAYCGGKGKVPRNGVEPTPTKCEVQPNMFPPHKKVCSITLVAKCECAK